YEGSAAAPTAGLHFTTELFDQLRDKGVEILDVTLHIGLGTFRPVNEEDILDHEMHSEWYHMDQKTADALNKARAEGRRIIAVGTTSVRTLESVAQKYNGVFREDTDETSIFIYPGYKWLCVDALITNFHLPESTLIMLVCSFAGKENVLKAYEHAVKEKYRFFSFGDAMFIR
ncbi:MAG: tRNA preQ1(34) S-adenosylmethionine ribosyltransferase-isomerase QueA, partial [Erysipelotrichales bacterium]|nr:tRNA preQ1(34) S-adenosylmethionine ribosyltransferase-isomerase QueA [Erysipelotrichales bacterium]